MFGRPVSEVYEELRELRKTASKVSTLELALNDAVSERDQARRETDEWITKATSRQREIGELRANRNEQLKADRDAAVRKVNELTRERDNYKRWWEDSQGDAVKYVRLKAKLEELANE